MQIKDSSVSMMTKSILKIIDIMTCYKMKSKNPRFKSCLLTFYFYSFYDYEDEYQDTRGR